MVRHHYLRSTLLIALMMSAAIADAAQRQGPASRPGGAVRGAARESGSTGDGRESLDDLAAEAEKKNSWPEASVAYYQASIQARVTGQYQKAISFGNKAIEMGERAGSPLLQARAIFPLVYSYRYLGQKAQVRPLLQKGIEIVKQMPAGGAKQSVEANLYRELGVEFSLAGETQKAIETMSYSPGAGLVSLISSKARDLERSTDSSDARQHGHNFRSPRQRLSKPRPDGRGDQSLSEGPGHD